MLRTDKPDSPGNTAYLDYTYEWTPEGMVRVENTVPLLPPVYIETHAVAYKERPTIDELDAMLNNESDIPIFINPDGSVTTVDPAIEAGKVNSVPMGAPLCPHGNMPDIRCFECYPHTSYEWQQGCILDAERAIYQQEFNLGLAKMVAAKDNLDRMDRERKEHRD
jgi:hypothetical protein